MDPGELCVTRDSMHRAGGQKPGFNPWEEATRKGLGGSPHKAGLRRSVTGRTGGRKEAGMKDLARRPGGRMDLSGHLHILVHPNACSWPPDSHQTPGAGGIGS